MAIRFTQYLYPDGRPRAMLVDRPQEIERMARYLASVGYRFEIEILGTGKVHMDCSHPEVDAAIAIEVCDNGPDVPLAVDSLVERAYGMVKP